MGVTITAVVPDGCNTCHGRLHFLLRSWRRRDRGTSATSTACTCEDKSDHRLNRLKPSNLLHCSWWHIEVHRHDIQRCYPCR